MRQNVRRNVLLVTAATASIANQCITDERCREILYPNQTTMLEILRLFNKATKTKQIPKTNEVYAVELLLLLRTGITLRITNDVKLTRTRTEFHHENDH